jgi:mycothiol S-conjugate amidase
VVAGDDRRGAKLYGCRTHSPKRLRAMHDWLVASGHASPFGGALAAAESSPDPTTTRVDVSAQLTIARRALSAHRSQVAPDDPWFFSVPVESMRAIYPYEDFVIMRSSLPIVREADGYEHDLFAGIEFDDGRRPEVGS